MTEDRSLEEFGDAAGTDDTGGENDTDGDDGADAENEAADSPAPATSTSTVSPSGAPCEGCGAVVERRWLDAGEYVCTDCKDW